MSAQVSSGGYIGSFGEASFDSRQGVVLLFGQLIARAKDGDLSPCSLSAAGQFGENLRHHYLEHDVIGIPFRHVYCKPERLVQMPLAQKAADEMPGCLMVGRDDDTSGARRDQKVVGQSAQPFFSQLRREQQARAHIIVRADQLVKQLLGSAAPSSRQRFQSELFDRRLQGAVFVRQFLSRKPNADLQN